ncbi:U605 protein, partial [Acromyrmex charruanus]
ITTEMDLLITADPHFIPGYSGYCPQFQFNYGETYAKATHKLLLDPTINHAKTLVLTDRAVTDCERPSKSDIDVVNARLKRTAALFIHPMLPGYKGFIPGSNVRLGQRYAVHATEGLADFERQQLKNKAALDRLRRTINVQCGRVEPRNLEERLLVKTLFKLPLLPVRPEYVTSMNNLSSDKKCKISKNDTSSNTNINEEHFNCFCKSMKNLPSINKIPHGVPLSAKTRKKNISIISNILRKGYATHIPHGYFETSIIPSYDDALYSVAKCQKGQSVKYKITTIYPEPPLLVKSTEIYHKNVGMIPNYFGHIPGAMFRCGKTFGVDSKDVKKWLRRDFDL